MAFFAGGAGESMWDEGRRMKTDLKRQRFFDKLRMTTVRARKMTKAQTGDDVGECGFESHEHYRIASMGADYGTLRCAWHVPVIVAGRRDPSTSSG